MDNGKNLHIPNIATNDRYYKKQLSVFPFNIHIFSTSESVFYVYPEYTGKKGNDYVASLLFNFLYNHLDIFCDSCGGGQNKNYTLYTYNEKPD